MELDPGTGMRTQTDAKLPIDPSAIKDRVRRDTREGPITPNYGADLNVVLDLLNQALATEIVCWLRYTNHSLVARGIRAETVASEFEEHGRQELDHAMKIAARIAQLGGNPQLAPDRLAEGSHADYTVGSELGQMLRDNLFAERIAIEWYREMIKYLGTNDPTTRRIIEDILADEEHHADDLAGLLHPTAS